MAKKDNTTDHGDNSAPVGLDSPATFGPINRTRTKPGGDWPTQVPESCVPGELSYPCPKEE